MKTFIEKKKKSRHSKKNKTYTNFFESNLMENFKFENRKKSTFLNKHKSKP